MRDVGCGMWNIDMGPGLVGPHAQQGPYIAHKKQKHVKKKVTSILSAVLGRARPSSRSIFISRRSLNQLSSYLHVSPGRLSADGEVKVL